MSSAYEKIVKGNLPAVRKDNLFFSQTMPTGSFLWMRWPMWGNIRRRGYCNYFSELSRYSRGSNMGFLIGMIYRLQDLK